MGGSDVSEVIGEGNESSDEEADSDEAAALSEETVGNGGC